MNAVYKRVNIKSLPLPKRVNVEDDLVGHFGHLLSTGQGSDFTIEVGKSNHWKVKKESFPVHKVILAAKLPTFNATLSHVTLKEAKEGRYFIADVSKEVMDRFLRFIYTGAVDSPEQCYTLEMMALADKVCKTTLSLLIKADKMILVLTLTLLSTSLCVFLPSLRRFPSTM